MTRIKLVHKTEKKVLDVNNIDSFFGELQHRRKISDVNVRGIRDVLATGKAIEAPFVINKVNGINWLCDGNHRLEAMKLLLKEDPEGNLEIEIEIHKYDGLNEDAERKIYTAYNSGRKQSTNDFVQQYKDTIPLWKILHTDKTMPVAVTVYPGNNSISFYKLISAYNAAIDKGNFKGGYLGKPMDFIAKAINYGHKDAAIIKAFLVDYATAFGFVKGNPWYSTTQITSMMRVWMDNRKTMVPNTMVKHWKARLANDYASIQMSKFPGLSGTKVAREQHLQTLNGSRKTELFNRLP